MNFVPDSYIQQPKFLAATGQNLSVTFYDQGISYLNFFLDSNPKRC